MIRYYSAARPRTRWTIALDLALALSLVLAFPMAWLCNALVVQPSTIVSLSGQLFRMPDASIRAIVIISSKPPKDTIGKVIGNFDVEVRAQRRGWPLMTSLHRLPAQLDIDIVAEPKPRKNATLETDDPLRLAINQALADDQQLQALAAFQSDSPLVNQHWMSWTIATGVWWLVLTFASSLAIGLLQFITGYLTIKSRERRARRRDQGKCLACGYDLTGLEFNERCPECGELVW